MERVGLNPCFDRIYFQFDTVQIELYDGTKSQSLF